LCSHWLRQPLPHHSGAEVAVILAAAVAGISAAAATWVPAAILVGADRVVILTVGTVDTSRDREVISTEVATSSSVAASTIRSGDRITRMGMDICMGMDIHMDMGIHTRDIRMTTWGRVM
jgi:hypothetical protein